MDSQIYLLLIRSTGDYTDYEKEFENLNELTAPVIINELLSGMVMGDSLDTPFLQFIRVANLDHELSFGSKSTFDSNKGSYSDGMEQTRKHQYSPNPFLRSAKTSTPKAYNRKAAVDDRSRRFGATGKAKHDWSRLGRATGGNNQFVQSAIPEHGELVFSKYIDSATPQLAYGCASQEKFPLALFIYRRKIGLGMGGIRFPYFMIGGFKCKLKGWKLEGDMETVALHYRKIAWCGFLQWSDTNLSLPWSTRWFDQEEYKGGQYGAASGVQLIVSVITLLAGGVAAGVDAATSSVSSDNSNL